MAGTFPVIVRNFNDISKTKKAVKSGLNLTFKPTKRLCEKPDHEEDRKIPHLQTRSHRVYERNIIGTCTLTGEMSYDCREFIVCCLSKKIERRIDGLTRLIYRNPIKTLMVLLVVTCLLSAQIPKTDMDSSSEGMLHKSDPIRIAYNDFRNQFGRDDNWNNNPAGNRGLHRHSCG
jgi:hypothetical protein